MVNEPAVWGHQRDGVQGPGGNAIGHTVPIPRSRRGTLGISFVSHLFLDMGLFLELSVRPEFNRCFRDWVSFLRQALGQVLSILSFLSVPPDLGFRLLFRYYFIQAVKKFS